MKKLMKSIKILLATVFVSLSAASQDGGEPIPASINFDWQVTQRMPKDAFPTNPPSATVFNPKYKNNIMAIPILNMNYLWAETEVGGKRDITL
jgi:hypothetical protein